jgi:porphobilinogen synthase
MKFHELRIRRLRKNKIIRNLVAENYILPSQLILPIFVKDGKNIKEEIKSLPGIYRYSMDTIILFIQEAYKLGIKTFALFPYVDQNLKSENADEAYNPDNLICRTIKEIKNKFGDNVVIVTDVALDPYTIDGHDGLTEDNQILNDETIEVLCKQALVQAASGSDIIAPSDMMDGRVINIRNALDIASFSDVMILSYSAKYASNLYFPFRDAIGSTNGKIDKSSYQLDYRNSKEAIREVELDISECADIIMIKPATFYLDIIKEVSERFDIPVFAYQVSGEYQMFKQCGGIELLFESLVSIKRAGATSIITYGAIEIAKMLN